MLVELSNSLWGLAVLLIDFYFLFSKTLWKSALSLYQIFDGAVKSTCENLLSATVLQRAISFYTWEHARAKETKTKLALFGELRVTLDNLKNSSLVTPTKWRNFPDQTDKSNLKRWFKHLYQLS